MSNYVESNSLKLRFVLEKSLKNMVSGPYEPETPLQYSLTSLLPSAFALQETRRLVAFIQDFLVYLSINIE